MGRISIVTAGDVAFAPMVRRTAEAAERMGYGLYVYDLGGLGFGKPLAVKGTDLKKYDGFVPCTFKPRAILDSLHFTDDGDYLFWLDGDAILTGSLDDALSEWDVAVTVRPKREIERYEDNPRVGRINTGVIGFRKTGRAVRFVREWIERTDRLNGDQHAMNEMAREGHEARIFEIPCSRYNLYDFSKGIDGASVVHFKGSQRRHFNTYFPQYA